MRANILISRFLRGPSKNDTVGGPPLISVLRRSFVNATPTAELEPITENYVQGDEVRRHSLKGLLS